MNQGTSMSRRAFCLAAGATAMNAVKLHAETPPATAFRFKKAVKFHMVRAEGDVSRKLALLAELGFDGTEIHARDEVDLKDARRAAEAAGIRIHGYLNSSLPDLKGAVDAATTLGADSVLVVAGRVDEKNGYDDVYKTQQARFREALPYAEKRGVRLLVENVWNNFLLSPLEMARFIDELESPAAGVYFDVGNVVRYGWPDQWIRILGARIVKLDIKEYSRKKQFDEGTRKGFDVEIGEGDCDWPAVRRALAEIGFTQGWATAEVPGGDRDRLAEIARRMDDVLAIDR